MEGFLREHMRRGPVYALFGATAAAVNWLLFLALHDGLQWQRHLAAATAVEVSILWGFTMHSLATFRSIDPHHALRGRFVLYQLVALAGLAVHMAAFTAILALADLEPRWAQLLAIPFATPVNYLAQRYVTWRAARPAPA